MRKETYIQLPANLRSRVVDLFNETVAIVLVAIGRGSESQKDKLLLFDLHPL